MNLKPTILVIEDDVSVSNLIATTLETQQYKYILAKNGQDGIHMAVSHNPDILLLDLGLPDMDGIQIIKKIRSWSTMPIIVVSARSDDLDKIEALDVGADDYITKPFSVNELLARLRVTLRRLHYIRNLSEKESSVFVNGSLKVDFNTNCVYVKNEELHLTPIEYKLLCLLCKNIGKVLTHKFITNEIWGNGWNNDVGSLRVFMATLRKKIEKKDTTQYIQTHVGIGYRMLRVEENLQ